VYYFLSGFVQICSATMGFAVKDRYLIIKAASRGYGAICLCRMFSEKKWNVN